MDIPVTSRQEQAPAFPVFSLEPPICCQDDMYLLMRRAILHSNGEVDFTAVWHCLMCGRLVL